MEQREKIISDYKKIDAKTFSIPSQNGNGSYIVTIGKKYTCSCPDFQDRKKDCKHIHAVRFYLDFNKKVKIENSGINNRKLRKTYSKCSSTI